MHPKNAHQKSSCEFVHVSVSFCLLLLSQLPNALNNIQKDFLMPLIPDLGVLLGQQTTTKVASRLAKTLTIVGCCSLASIALATTPPLSPDTEAKATETLVTMTPTQLAIANAKSLYAEGNYEAAIELLESLEKSADTYIELIMNYAQTDLDESEELSDDSIEAYPDNARLYYLRGVVMGSQAQSSIFSALGYAEKSLNSFVKATELAPEEVQYKRALMSFYMAAPSIAGGDEDLGKAELDKIKALDPLEGAASEVAFYQMSDEMDKAKATLKKAMEQFKDEINFPFQLGSLYAREEDYADAMRYFQKAADMPLPEFTRDPVTGEIDRNYRRNAKAQLDAVYQVGRTAVVSETDTKAGIAAMGRLQAAVQSSKLAPNDLPNMNWASARLTELYLQDGNKSAAKAELEKVRYGEDENLEDQVKKLKKQLR